MISASTTDLPVDEEKIIGLAEQAYATVRSARRILILKDNDIPPALIVGQ